MHKVLIIRSSRWPVLIASAVVAALCLAPSARAERSAPVGGAVVADQSAAGCQADCTVGKQSIVTLLGVDTTKAGAMVIRDGRGRYAAISNDFRQLLVFDQTGRLLDSPRPTFGRIVNLFVDSMGAAQTYDFKSGSLLTFDTDYKVKTERELPHSPTLPLAGGRFLVASLMDTPALVGHPLHVMSKDGGLVRSFGATGGTFRSDETFKNLRLVCLNPDGTIWSIAPGSRLLERWDASTGRRLAQVTVKSTWFRESSGPAREGQQANPIILTIWAEKGLVWILYRAPDPKWVPRQMSEKEELASTGELQDRRSDWILEAVRSDTGIVVAMKSFDRALLRRDGSFAIGSATSANQAGGVELWTPIVVKK